MHISAEVTDSEGAALSPSVRRGVWLRRLMTPLILVAAVSILGCIPSFVAPPAGSAGLRYRDEIFPNVTIINDLQYGSAPDLQERAVALKLDLYEPAGDTVIKRPAVIWVHGGGYSRGDKGAGPSVILATEFAKLGYVAVSINYRLLAPSRCDAGGGIAPACATAAVEAVHDAQAAVRWLRAHASEYGIDPDRIGIGGESAGGITATGVGVSADTPGDSGTPGYASTVRGWVSISGGLPGGLFVDGTDAPGLLFAGTADKTVPHQWSVETATAMQKAGVPVVLKTLEGAGHVPWIQYSDLFIDQSIFFLYEYLDLEHAAR
jgi:acetyl esterase/lipase